MNNIITKNTIIKSLLWKFSERIGVQALQFIIQIILARLLLPKDFGLIVLVIIFITIANVLVQNSFNTALIQNKDTDKIDYSTVFFINLIIATVVYGLLFILSPILAVFFDNPLLENILKILSLTVFFGAMSSVQVAILTKNMQFRKQFMSSLVSIVISGIIGVWMAFEGYGVWALVAQQLLSQIIIVIVLFFIVDWRPQFIFSFQRAKILFSFGWKMLVSSLIDVIYTNSRSLVIGKMYTPDMLAYYNRGEQLPSLIVNNINGSIQSVIFPALSAYQDDKEKVKSIVRRAVTLSSFAVFPMMAGLAASAESVVELLLTDKWLEAVPFVQIACLYFAFWPVHTANLQAISALGRSDIFLKLEIIKKVIGIIILLFTIPLGVYAIMFGTVIGSIFSLFINAAPNKKLLNYSYLEQFKDILPNLIVSILMLCIISGVNYIDLSNFLTLSLQILIGVVSYIILAWIFRNESFLYIYKSVKNKMNSSS